MRYRDIDDVHLPLYLRRSKEDRTRGSSIMKTKKNISSELAPYNISHVSNMKTWQSENIFLKNIMVRQRNHPKEDSIEN